MDPDLAPGRRIAVVGPSGSGKTTLALVLLRFLDQTSGAVTGSVPVPGPVGTRAPAWDGVRRVTGGARRTPMSSTGAVRLRWSPTAVPAPGCRRRRDPGPRPRPDRRARHPGRAGRPGGRTAP
ncbi:ATP-binding cassette domain-containing protein [Streptomyces sp. NBC_00063]|uniref:ATP-binding cassette domain-containing protein n=1 Tax=Streptomyces sp. NBC_00063 TaxID=2975638 RepID=UPI003D717CC8